jgi:3-oxoadipate enol-lactonase
MGLPEAGGSSLLTLTPLSDFSIVVWALKAGEKIMLWVDVEGVQLAYRVDGQGAGLVLVHGTGGNAETNWGHLVEDLASDWKVVRPDYAGSGATRDAGGVLTVEKLAAQVVAAAEAAGAVPFDLVGFSLGTAVAIRIAAEYPHKVRRLVLLGAFLHGRDARQQIQFGLWRDLIQTDRNAMARVLMLTGFSPDFLLSLDEKGMADALEGIQAGTDWEGMARQVELDLCVDVTSDARRVTCPTLVIGSRFDNMVPPAYARATAAAIGGARYVEMAAGHLALLEQPAEFLALLRGFLRGG